MADILYEFPVFVPIEKVFEAVTTPAGINAWWTLTCSGEPTEGSTYDLGFGDRYQWQAHVTIARPDAEFELEVTVADEFWLGTRVGFILSAGIDRTTVNFYHRGWPEESEHFRISSYCWAMYLRIMKRHVELGEHIDYERRLDV